MAGARALNAATRLGVNWAQTFLREEREDGAPD